MVVNGLENYFDLMYIHTDKTSDFHFSKIWAFTVEKVQLLCKYQGPAITFVGTNSAS